MIRCVLEVNCGYTDFGVASRDSQTSRDEIRGNWHFRGLVVLLVDLDVDGIAFVT